MDELLLDRVKRLEEVYDRLRDIDPDDPADVRKLVRRLQDDLVRWIDQARNDYEAF